ncbi:hypothetical protein R1flu_025286 [Riccia fluitans]|uniref:WAT1-related protein n=1 Tax=Riccia fluitans TaxID=41844 RepID=A0ABD1XXB6_9MARC
MNQLTGRPNLQASATCVGVRVRVSVSLSLQTLLTRLLFSTGAQQSGVYVTLTASFMSTLLPLSFVFRKAFVTRLRTAFYLTLYSLVAAALISFLYLEVTSPF